MSNNRTVRLDSWCNLQGRGHDGVWPRVTNQDFKYINLGRASPTRFPESPGTSANGLDVIRTIITDVGTKWPQKVGRVNVGGPCQVSQ